MTHVETAIASVVPIASLGVCSFEFKSKGQINKSVGLHLCGGDICKLGLAEQCITLI